MPNQARRPQLSVVVPVYDVAEYLPAFLESLDSAQCSTPTTEIIFVDDGSRDAGPEIIENWIEESPLNARIISTQNLGVGSARNTGLDAATGEWVCFLDPDDVLGSRYFDHLSAFISAHPEVALVATALRRIDEPDPRFRDSHPLRFRFAGGSRVATLQDDVFVMNVASVAFPAARLRSSGARFRIGLHASEDALFVSDYLLSMDRPPLAGFAADAHYGYRKRQAGTSAVDRYRTDPTTYTHRFREGYEPLMRSAAAVGEVPTWLQSMVLYEMQWLLPVQWDPSRHAMSLSAAQRKDTLKAIAGCLQYVDEDRLLRYDATALPLESRLVALALTGRRLWDWIGAYASTPRRWHAHTEVVSYVREAKTAAAPGSVRWYPGYFDQKVLQAIRTRVADESLEAQIDGKTVPIVRPRPGETLAQTQDRHRRDQIGAPRPFIPALEGEVYVRRTRPWANDIRSRAAIRRQRRRRTIWSKDAMIGRAFRPGRGWLVEHDPDDPDHLTQLLQGALAELAPTDIANAPGSSALPDGIRFGSFRHRLTRARARVIVSTRVAAPPSTRSRIRGLRVLILRRPLDREELLRVRAFRPEIVVTAVAEDREALASIGILPDDVLVAPTLDPGELAAILTEFVASRDETTEGHSS